jgi:hypothetical protein
MESDDDFAAGYVLVASTDIDAVDYIAKRVRMELTNLIWDEENQNPKKPVVHHQHQQQQYQQHQGRFRGPNRTYHQRQGQVPQLQQGRRATNQTSGPWYKKNDPQDQEPIYDDEVPVSRTKAASTSTTTAAASTADISQPLPSVHRATNGQKARMPMPMPRKVLGPATKLAASDTFSENMSVKSWADDDADAEENF